MYQKINSPQNSRIKALFQLKEKSRNRKKEGLFLIEGHREIELAIKGGYQLQTLLFNPSIIQQEAVVSLSKKLRIPAEIIEISAEIYEKIAYRISTEGIIAVAKIKDHAIQSLKPTTQNPLLLIAEAPEKPGNIGALLRTADAAGVDAILIANPKTDLYNPNIIRSSIGCIFTTTIATGTTTEIISFLEKHHIHIYGATLQASVPYDTVDYTKATAIVVGTEATGLSQEWLTQTSQNIIIPMHGQIDSMNVSVAAGILIFEAKRQRGF